MYDFSCWDGLNVFSMLIGLTRYIPDNVRTRDRTTYYQFLNSDAMPPVGHDATIITSFDIPCNLWSVVALLVLAGICFILHQDSVFLFDVSKILTDTFVENDSGSSLNLQSFISVDSLFAKFSRYD